MRDKDREGLMILRRLGSRFVARGMVGCATFYFGGQSRAARSPHKTRNPITGGKEKRHFTRLARCFERSTYELTDSALA